MSRIDVNKLTLGEIDRIESLSGQGIGALGDEDAPKGKLLAAFMYVYKRRDLMAEGKDLGGFGWNDALAVPFDEAQTFLGIGEGDDEDAGEVDPTREAVDDAAPVPPTEG